MRCYLYLCLFIFAGLNLTSIHAFTVQAFSPSSTTKKWSPKYPKVIATPRLPIKGELKVASVPSNVLEGKQNLTMRRHAIKNLSPDQKTYAKQQLEKLPEPTIISDSTIASAQQNQSPASYVDFLKTFKGTDPKIIIPHLAQ